MRLRWIYRFGVVLGLLALEVACSNAMPGGTGPQSSGTPAATTAPATTTVTTTTPSSPSQTPTAAATPSDVSNPQTVLPPSGPVCGNSITETGEECDDGNGVSGDGCSVICKKEFCGDGIVQSSLDEECEVGNLNGITCSALGFSLGNLSCNGTCKFDKSGCSNPVPSPVCGNGKVEAGEECDDGNTTSGDGCNSICKKEFCGDGVVQSGLSEECDGVNLNGSSCTTLGYTAGTLSCNGTCTFVKTGCSSICGNGKVEAGEGCDDGNTLSWDGCSSTCQVEVAPTFIDNFTTSVNSPWVIQDPYGSMTYALDSLASDQKVAKLTFSGGQSNAEGPDSFTQINTKSLLGFGLYRARVDFAKCASSEELVNGIFTYSHGGNSDGTTTVPVDGNKNGITDNNEIDFELLCGEPTWLWLTIWTDYDNDSSFRKVSRVFDLTTGKAYQTTPGKEGQYNIDWSTVVATIPEMKLPTLATDDKYYELGFEWKSTSLRYFIVINGQEVTLWNFTNATYIPQNKAFMMFNLWHTDTHWYSEKSASYPANAESLKVDWFKYWAN